MRKSRKKRAKRTGFGDLQMRKYTEVEPSLHDDDEENRVYVSTGHTLVIEKATYEDQGTYFCRDTTTEDRHMKMIMSARQIKDMLTAHGTFKFIIHVNG
nr:hypothetical protein BaRGS_032761 [Batillaria attramentaria]